MWFRIIVVTVLLLQLDIVNCSNGLCRSPTSGGVFQTCICEYPVLLNVTNGIRTVEVTGDSCLCNVSYHTIKPEVVSWHKDCSWTCKDSLCGMYFFFVLKSLFIWYIVTVIHLKISRIHLI